MEQATGFEVRPPRNSDEVLSLWWPNMKSLGWVCTHPAIGATERKREKKKNRNERRKLEPSEADHAE